MDQETSHGKGEVKFPGNGTKCYQKTQELGLSNKDTWKGRRGNKEVSKKEKKIQGNPTITHLRKGKLLKYSAWRKTVRCSGTSAPDGPAQP